MVKFSRSQLTGEDYLSTIDEIEEDWSKFRRALTTQEDKKIFDKVIRHSRIHNKAANQTEGSRSLETFFMSVILEQQLKIMRLKKKLDDMD